MNGRRLFKYAVYFLFLICCFPQPAHAYIGPGTGMSAVGVFLAVAMGIVIALFGFIWYPVKRLLRTYKTRNAAKKCEQTA